MTNTIDMVSITATCPICGHSNTIMVYSDDYDRWQNGGLAQDCFPYLSAEDREMLISGICPECWDRMFGGDEDEDEDEPDFEDGVDEYGYDPYLGCYTEDC